MIKTYDKKGLYKDRLRIKTTNENVYFYVTIENIPVSWRIPKEEIKEMLRWKYAVKKI